MPTSFVVFVACVAAFAVASIVAPKVDRPRVKAVLNGIAAAALVVAVLAVVVALWGAWSPWELQVGDRK